MSVSAVLLAGGASRRMGQDKATLLWRGVHLWQRQLELLRKLEPGELLVSARKDPPWRPADAAFVADVPPSCGPLSGLAAALAQMRSTHLLVLAVDLPFMNERYLRSLLEQAGAGQGVISVMQGRGEPLAAIYPAAALAYCEAALEGQEFSLQALMRKLIDPGKLRVVPVSREDEGLFRNLNEPRDIV